MSNEPTIEQMNLVIARFMGQIRMHPSDMRYHSSWDWLIPVVAKIKECFNETINIDAEITNMHNSGINFQLAITNISSAHVAVYYSIQWYNNQTCLDFLKK